MDIREKTTLVVEKDGEYLTGMSMFLRWSLSPYDAWMTRNIEHARMVADKVGGRIMLFNPIAYQLKPFGQA